jgi:MoxR-like ATPase
MFTSETVNLIYSQNRDLLRQVLDLEKQLLARFYGMDVAIRCMMLSAMSGEAMVMIGSPGTAKSRLIRAFCSLIGVLDRDPRDSAEPSAQQGAAKKKDERYFEYLLTQFTEPSELFGYFDLAKLQGGNPVLERMTHGQMQRAEVVFLDEVFNASSAILNALLTFMNERKFHDRGIVHDAPMKMLFAATNHPPREEGLGAVYDRFLLRCRIENAAAGRDSLASLLQAAWTETHEHGQTAKGLFKTLPGALELYRYGIDELTTCGALKIDPVSKVVAQLASVVATVRAKELSDMSNRRLVKFSAIILAQALLRAQAEGAATAAIAPRDLIVILDYGLDQPDPGVVEKLRQELFLA